MIVRGWRLAEGALIRELIFKDDAEALRFVDELGRRVVDYGRRPGVAVTDYNHVQIRVENLHHAGITAAERRLARKVDAALADDLRPPH
jgi:pterin-4a-carbinolamine dehydratase